jgi:iron(III) transport system substrate-binding protein
MVQGYFQWIRNVRFALLGVVPLLLLLLPAGCGKRGPEVVVYTSQDQVYSKPILDEFTRQTGIKVRAFYDSEAVKTVGIANRLLAEKNNPQADLFWNNEELRTRQLAAAGVFRQTDPWSSFGYRSRRLVVNTNLLDLSDAPRSLETLTNETWRGKVAVAYPLFGTTATHFLALRVHWGKERWESWCRALQANDPFVVDGNSVVVNQFVGKGEAVVGLTDSDDIAAGQREGLPVAAAPLMEETMLIPNTVGIIRGGPNPEAARRLSDYLQSDRVIERLVEVNALEGANTNELSTLGIRPDWSALLEDLETATTNLSKIFLRE